MGLSAKVGQFNTNTGTGNQAITGVGFQPKLVMLFSTLVSGDPYLSPNFGVAQSSSARWAIAAHAYGNPETPLRYFSSSKCFVHAYNASFVLVYLAYDFVSMDSDGFTLNQTTASGVAYPINYIAIGGTDFEVEVGTFNANNTTGNQDVNIGITPKALIFSENSLPNEDGLGSISSASFGMGMGVSSSNRYASGLDAEPGSTTDSNSVLSAAKMWCHTYTGNTVVFDGDLVSLSANKFTVNITTVLASNYLLVGYVALGGTAQYNITTFSTPSSTGNQATTGVGFQPIIDLFLSAGKTSSNSPSDSARVMIGAAVSSSQRGAIFSSEKDVTGTNFAPWNRHTSGTLSTVFTNDENTTIISGSDFVSQNADGYTNNFTTADATARVIATLSIGVAAIPQAFPTKTILRSGTFRSGTYR